LRSSSSILSVHVRGSHCSCSIEARRTAGRLQRVTCSISALFNRVRPSPHCHCDARVLALQVRAILPPLFCGSKDKRLVSLEWRSSLPRAFNPTMFGRAARAILLDGSLAAHAFDLIVFGLPVRFLGALWRSGRRRLFWGVASAVVLLQAAAFISMVYWSR
jgi:hypothetical protein